MPAMLAMTGASRCAEPVFDERVDLGQLAVQVEDDRCQFGDERRGYGLAADAYLLVRGRLGRRIGQPAGASDTVAAQVPFKPCGAGGADAGGGLVLADQDERAVVGEVQRPFQGGGRSPRDGRGDG